MGSVTHRAPPFPHGPMFLLYLKVTDVKVGVDLMYCIAIAPPYPPSFTVLLTNELPTKEACEK
jgi:hypothetical protein